MDGIGRAMGAGVPIKFGGETFMMARVSARILGELEQYMLAKRTSPVDLALTRIAELEKRGTLISDATRNILLQQAVEQESKGFNFITREEFGQWLDTREGVAVSLWLLLRENHKDVKLEFVTEEIIKASQKEFEDILRLREQSSGTDDLGNETGSDSPTSPPSQSPGQATKEEMAAPDLNTSGATGEK